jgi:hypothetical protein
MLRHVALVRTGVSEELFASIIRVTRIRALETLVLTSNRSIFLYVDYVRTSQETRVSVSTVCYWGSFTFL